MWFTFATPLPVDPPDLQTCLKRRSISGFCKGFYKEERWEREGRFEMPKSLKGVICIQTNGAKWCAFYESYRVG
jgi:hypothetical protein